MLWSVRGEEDAMFDEVLMVLAFRGDDAVVVGGRVNGDHQ